MYVLRDSGTLGMLHRGELCVVFLLLGPQANLPGAAKSAPGPDLVRRGGSTAGRLGGAG